MNTEDYSDQILAAVELVSAWDIPDEDFAQAVNDQAKLTAGFSQDDFVDIH